MPDPFFDAVDTLNNEVRAAEGDPDAGRPDNDPTRPTLIPELRPYWEKYTDDTYQSNMEPLRVIVHVNGPMAGYDPPTFDGILARMVTDDALSGDTLDGQQSPYLLPVPLYRLWADPETGLPLWACNHYAPAGPTVDTTITIHKRMIQDVHASEATTPRQPDPKRGRHKTKRIHHPATEARAWWADCIGNAEEIRRLLSQLDAMGKKRRALVQSIEVRPIDQFQMNRPVPLRYFDEDTEVEQHGYMGWSPPYWSGVPVCQAECGVPA